MLKQPTSKLQEVCLNMLWVWLEKLWMKLPMTLTQESQFSNRKREQKNVKFTITGKSKDVDAAQYIFQKIVKSNIHKLNQVRPITNS